MITPVKKLLLTDGDRECGASFPAGRDNQKPDRAKQLMQRQAFAVVQGSRLALLEATAIGSTQQITAGRLCR